MEFYNLTAYNTAVIRIPTTDDSIDLIPTLNSVLANRRTGVLLFQSSSRHTILESFIRAIEILSWLWPKMDGHRGAMPY
jgi:hypothetical protein